MIFYGPKENPEAQELDQKSPEPSTRVEGAPPYLVDDSETPRRETDAKNSYKYRNPHKIT